MPQFLINTGLPENSAEVFLSKEESRHLKVLRYKKKDKVKLFDLKGNRYEGEIKDFSQGAAIVKVLGKLENPPKKVEIKIYLPFVEKGAFEFMLRHCTEAGADIFVPLETEYSQKNFIPDVLERKERLGKIILSSVKQCERPDIPFLAPADCFEKVLSLGENFVLLSRDGTEERSLKPAEVAAETGEKISLLVGPEAGFSRKELALAREKKAVFMDLGPYILRTQTAAVAACAVIRALKWSDPPAGPLE